MFKKHNWTGRKHLWSIKTHEWPAVDFLVCGTINSFATTPSAGLYVRIHLYVVLTTVKHMAREETVLNGTHRECIIEVYWGHCALSPPTIAITRNRLGHTSQNILRYYKIYSL